MTAVVVDETDIVVCVGIPITCGIAEIRVRILQAGSHEEIASNRIWIRVLLIRLRGAQSFANDTSIVMGNDVIL
ncbi:MAG: hypothetical protein C5B44_01575 [Acidobacteria bacterium]|nr:MAG: hypothetical protein C5B44_01575 [Acidobacteriota bacterium]